MLRLKPAEHGVMPLAWIASIRHICENPFIVLTVAPPCRQQQSLQGIENDRCARRSCRTAQNGRVVTPKKQGARNRDSSRYDAVLEQAWRVLTAFSL